MICIVLGCKKVRVAQSVDYTRIRTLLVQTPVVTWPDLVTLVIRLLVTFRSDECYVMHIG